MISKNAFCGCVALTAAALLGACSNDDALDSISGQTDGRITLTSTVASTRVSGQDTQNTQIASGVEVGVFATTSAADESTVLDNGDNASYTSDGNGNLTASSTMYWPESGDVYFYAYAPYQESLGLTTAADFTITSDQSDEDGYLASDLIYGVPSSNPVEQTESAVALAFTHVLSKINVTVSTTASDVDLADATVSLLNVLPTASFTASTGTVGEASGTATTITVGTLSESDEYKCSAIIVPQTFNSTTSFMQVALSDGTVYQCALGTEKTFTSGYAYSYTLTISSDESGATTMEVSYGTTLSDWESEDESSLDAEEVIVYAVGDYLLSDGTFVKSEEVSSTDDVIGVIFSTEVSDIDAAEGYIGYVARFETMSGYAFATTSSEETIEGITSPTTIDEAISHLDGLTETTYYQEQNGDLDADSAPYPLFANLPADIEDTDDHSFSSWFVPSIGQFIQILNNLGEAGITGLDSDGNTITKTKFQCFPNVTDEGIEAYNSESSNTGYVTNSLKNRDEILGNMSSYVPSSVSFSFPVVIYATSTQRYSDFWLPNFSYYVANSSLADYLDSESGATSYMDYAWELSYGSQTSLTRYVLPVIAYK